MQIEEGIEFQHAGSVTIDGGELLTITRMQSRESANAYELTRADGTVVGRFLAFPAEGDGYVAYGDTIAAVRVGERYVKRFIPKR